MNLPDSFYIALCMTILLVGAVYWVWTQIQYVQRKVNVLENIVYELKTLCTARGEEASVGGSVMPTQYPPAPSSVLGEDEDLLHQTLQAEIQPVPMTPPYSPPHSPPRSPHLASGPFAIVEEVPLNDLPLSADEDIPVVAPAPVTANATEEEGPMDMSSADVVTTASVESVAAAAEPIFDMSSFIITSTKSAPEDELQPGGIGSGVVVPSIQSSLEGMTLKELRRLAQQKGISGANDMKKRELVEAIRAVPIESFLE